MATRALPRHARPPGVQRWPGWMANRAHLRAHADRDGPASPARYDPLIHSVAITGACLIGDQIRVPAAWCDMGGCGSRFTDPTALGEADNRARALGAGWAQDALGQLVCPSCQQRHRVTPAPQVPPRAPDTAANRATAAGRAGPQVSSLPPFLRSLRVRLQGTMSRTKHRTPRWLVLLIALASGNNGWAASQEVTAPAAGTVPPEANDPAGRLSAAHHPDGTGPQIGPFCAAHRVDRASLVAVHQAVLRALSRSGTDYRR